MERLWERYLLLRKELEVREWSPSPAFKVLRDYLRTLERTELLIKFDKGSWRKSSEGQTPRRCPQDPLTPGRRPVT